MALSVYHPSTPYVGPIQGGLQPGMQIIVSGTPDGSQERFAINLQCGEHNERGIALHFNPRFNQNQVRRGVTSGSKQFVTLAQVFEKKFEKKKVVRNTQKSGSWGPEELSGHFPFQRNCPFEILIHVQPNCYMVSVNGQHYCNYNHRMPLNDVTHVRVTDGVRLHYIKAEVPFPRTYPVGGELAPVYNPPVPYRQNIGCLFPNRMIFLSGIPRTNGSRFSIYLDTGNDTALTLDVRFAFGNDRNQVVRNSKQNGAWGSEERHLTHFPFRQDMFFDMIILVTPNCFKIAVNNQHYLEYNHRIHPVTRVDTLRIENDIKLCHVRFQ